MGFFQYPLSFQCIVLGFRATAVLRLDGCYSFLIELPHQMGDGIS